MVEILANGRFQENLLKFGKASKIAVFRILKNHS